MAHCDNIFPHLKLGRVAQLCGRNVNWLYANNCEVCLEIAADHLSAQALSIAEGDGYDLCSRNNVVIGKDMALIIQENTGSNA